MDGNSFVLYLIALASEIVKGGKELTLLVMVCWVIVVAITHAHTVHPGLQLSAAGSK